MYMHIYIYIHIYVIYVIIFRHLIVFHRADGMYMPTTCGTVRMS